MNNVKHQLTAIIQPGVTHDDEAPVLNVSNLTLRYHEKTVLDAISFSLIRGERMAVVGPNGAGKSTLFKVIAGLLTPSDGTVQIYGHEPGRHICIAYVPQRSQVDWHFPVNVFDVVMMGRTGKIELFRRPKRKDRELVLQCLDLVGMADLAGRQIGELSGGQQQRVFIARALAQEAALMLMDEPMTGLDVASQDDIFAIINELHQRHVTVMVSTHDLNQAADYFDRVMLLNRKLFGVGTAPNVFTLDNLSTAYGTHMRVLGNNDNGNNSKNTAATTVMVDSCCESGCNCVENERERSYG